MTAYIVDPVTSGEVDLFSAGAGLGADALAHGLVAFEHHERLRARGAQGFGCPPQVFIEPHGGVATPGARNRGA
jgi:hypothetical protein